LLDFRKISLSSQLTRVDSGEIPLEGFDFFYAHQFLARPGYLALEQMKADVGDSNPRLLEMIENPQPIRTAEGRQNIDKFWERMVFRPAPFEVPLELKAKIQQNALATYPGEVVIIEIDLNDDGQNEYAVVRTQRGGVIHALYFYLTDDGWQQGRLDVSGQDFMKTDVTKALKEGEIRLQRPQFDDLIVGDVVLKPN
jgi:hypothetical protein